MNEKLKIKDWVEFKRNGFIDYICLWTYQTLINKTKVILDKDNKVNSFNLSKN